MGRPARACADSPQPLSQCQAKGLYLLAMDEHDSEAIVLPEESCKRIVVAELQS